MGQTKQSKAAFKAWATRKQNYGDNGISADGLKAIKQAAKERSKK